MMKKGGHLTHKGRMFDLIPMHRDDLIHARLISYQSSNALGTDIGGTPKLPSPLPHLDPLLPDTIQLDLFCTRAL